MKRMLLAGFATMLLSGCDDVLAPFGENRRRMEEQAAQIEKEAVRERAEKEKKELASAIKATIMEKRKLFETRLSDVVETRRLLQMDSDNLTKAIAEAMGKRGASGEEPKHEVKVLNVLKDEKVNALAAKYLGSDFSAAKEKFISDVKNGRAEESRYRKAIAEADAVHSSSLANTTKWNDRTREQREREIARLRHEIGALESRLGTTRKEISNLTKNKLVGNKREERERVDKSVSINNKLNEIQDEISRKRRQLDSLTNPDNTVAVEYRSTYSSQSVQDRADYTHRKRLDDIDRTMKPKRTLSEIVAACESETYGRLQGVLTSQLAASDKAEAEFRGKIDKLMTMNASLPLATTQELNIYRKKLLDF